MDQILFSIIPVLFLFYCVCFLFLLTLVIKKVTLWSQTKLVKNKSSQNYYYFYYLKQHIKCFLLQPEFPREVFGRHYAAFQCAYISFSEGEMYFKETNSNS